MLNSGAWTSLSAVSAKITSLASLNDVAVTVDRSAVLKLLMPSARRISARYGPNGFVEALFVTEYIRRYLPKAKDCADGFSFHAYPGGSALGAGTPFARSWAGLRDARLAYGFRLATARPPTPAEQAVLHDELFTQWAKYHGRADAAKKAITFGESKPDASLDAGELAAYAMVANLILNLDEVVTKN